MATPEEFARALLREIEADKGKQTRFNFSWRMDGGAASSGDVRIIREFLSKQKYPYSDVKIYDSRRDLEENITSNVIEDIGEYIPREYSIVSEGRDQSTFLVYDVAYDIAHSNTAGRRASSSRTSTKPRHPKQSKAQERQRSITSRQPELF